MKLRIIALSQRMPAWVEAGYAEYSRRMPREWSVDLVELKPESRDRGKTTEQLLAAEARRIDASCAGQRVIALDERGSAWSTRQLADELERHRADGDDLAFVIGSADGLHEDVKRRAIARFAVSALTLPHGLVRVVLAEQLYRAYALATGHPYHRE